MAQLELVQAGFGTPERQNRWTVLIRLILAIPHGIVLWALGIAVEVVVFLGWFAALVTGRFPAAFAPLVTGYIRYQIRVGSYVWLMHGAYPPVGWVDPYGVDVFIPSSPVRRLAVLFRIVLILPAAVVSSVVGVGMAVSSIVVWLIVLVSGRMPASLFGAVAAVLRYQARYSSYAFMLTAKYPGELLGDDPSGLSTAVGATGPAVQWGARPPLPPASEAPAPAPAPDDAPAPAPGPAPPPPGYGPPPAPGYPPPAPGYPPPAPGYAPPGYAPPPAPGYGPPPAPGYPPPAPGYAPPGYAPPPVQTDRLVLSRASRRIVVLFIVLGVLGYGGIAAAIGIAAATTSSTRAFVDAHNTLQDQLSSAESQRSSCTLGQIPCLDQFWTQLSGDFQQFETTLSGISVPASAQADDTALQNDTKNLVSLLQQLASEDPSSITQTQLSQLQALSTAFDDDSVRLADELP